jgi:nicotinamide-nucleotide amidase
MNSGEIARALDAQGFRVSRVTVVGDDPAALRALFAAACDRSDEVICTGGLGPTEDDLTAAAVGKAMGLALVERAEARRHVEEWLRTRGREMSEAEARQVRFPHEATLINNPTGSAMGFCVSQRQASLWCLPGVPTEMRAMLAADVIPGIQTRHRPQGYGAFSVGVFGLPEAEIATRLADVDLEGRRLGYTAGVEGNWLTIRRLAADDTGQRLFERLFERLGGHIFSTEGRPLQAVVASLLTERAQTLATAESCTGGRLAQRLTSVPGASAWMLEGAVVYANEAKTRVCGVTEAQLRAHGAVSESVARAMAEGVQAHANADWGVGTTGIAGPTGGTPTKPVGTVHIAVSGPAGTNHRRLQLRGDRERIATQATSYALNVLRRCILDL